MGLCLDGQFIHSESVSRIENLVDSEWSEALDVAVGPQKGSELNNQQSCVNILIDHNFSDFDVVEGCTDVYYSETIEEIEF